VYNPLWGQNIQCVEQGRLAIHALSKGGVPDYTYIYLIIYYIIPDYLGEEPSDVESHHLAAV
jgi:hypothetical protein